MRILHISDFHGNEPWFEWAHSVMRRFDLCVYSGDWLAFGRDDIWQQIARVSHWIRDCPVPLVTCSGNHDGVSPHRKAGTMAKTGFMSSAITRIRVAFFCVGMCISLVDTFSRLGISFA